MEQMRTIVQASAVYRALAALCLWFGGQWRGSGLIQWFIHPRSSWSGRSRTTVSLPGSGSGSTGAVPPVPGPAPGQAV